MYIRIAILITAIVLMCFYPIYAQNYVGSYTCGFNCHNELYVNWSESGHGNNLIQIFGSEPEYPFEYHFGSVNVPNPPQVNGIQLSWDDIEYVIGGYRWKTNFVDTDGYIITGEVGDETQWNVEDQVWTDYRSGEQVEFDCGECHSTGYDPEGHQGSLPGITGTWAESGVGCEACHGPNT